MPNGYPQEVTRRLLLSGALVFLAVLPPVFALLGMLKPEAETLASWFQRSGSLSVMLAVFAELMLFKLQKYPGVTGFIDVKDGWSLSYRVIAYAAGFVGIVGTVIWGYGDIFIS